MTSREEFLNGFEVICNKYSSDICFYLVTDSDGTLGVTYFQLKRLTNDLSLFFSRIFAGNEEYVGVSLTDYFFLPSIIISIWKSGNVFAGVGTQYLLQNTLSFLNFLQVRYLISDKNEEYFEGKKLCEFHIENQVFFIWEREIQKEKQNCPQDICYGIMTSGTTGNIKTIQVPWSCILPNAKELQEEFIINNFDCIFLASPCTFDPFFIELFLVLLSGGSMVIVSNQSKLNPSKLLQILFCEKETSVPYKKVISSHFNNENHFSFCSKPVQIKKITVLQITPSVFKRWTSDQIKSILSSTTTLRILILGGEKFPEDILKLKSHNNNTKIYNIYGITEISCWAFLKQITDFSSSNKVSLGKPLKNITYTLSKCNELLIGSLNRKCFIDFEKHNESEEIIFRNTGDVVELTNNELFYVGRSNQIFKKYGIKLNLNKIEELFLGKNPSMDSCYCVYDQENSKLGLIFVPEEKKIFPQNYCTVSLEEFDKLGFKYPIEELSNIEKPDVLVSVVNPPINSHGKCDRKKLLEWFKNLTETPKCVGSLRETFMKIWSEALNVGRGDSTTQSFVNLGGTSISALEIINKLEDSGVNVPQNFITSLLKEGNFEDCLNLLSVDGVPRKKVKFGEDYLDILSVKWKFDLQKCIDATPTIVLFEGKERVVVGSHSHKLCCLDASSGNEIWSILLGDRIESGFSLAKNTIRGYIGCYDNFVYCISVVDGTCFWKYKTEDMVKSTPCVSTDGKTVYAASYDRCLYCLSATDGSLLRKTKLSEGGIFSSGVVSDVFNSFYIGTLDGTCVALNQNTNECVWKTKLKSPVFATPCLLSGDSKIVFAEVLGIVHCFDSLTGDEVWNYQANGNIYSSPICRNLGDTTLTFFGCHDSHLYCLQNDKLKWKQQLESPVFARPSLIGSEDGRVCVATTKGFIYLCLFISGQVNSSIRLNGEIFSSPVQACRNIFVGCRDNYIYSLHLQK